MTMKKENGALLMILVMISCTLTIFYFYTLNIGNTDCTSNGGIREEGQHPAFEFLLKYTKSRKQEEIQSQETLETQQPVEDECDPYEEGFLGFDSKWVSLNPSCQPNDYFSLLQNQPMTGLEWMIDKTLIFFGDSLDRNAIDTFCVLTNGTLSKRKPKNPNEECSGKYCLSYCAIESLNFTIFNYFQFGFEEDAEFWKKKTIHHVQDQEEGRLMEDRILLLKEAAQVYGRNIDYIVTQSLLWDIGGWTRKIVQNEQPLPLLFNTSRLFYWQNQLLPRLIDPLRLQFPATKIFWRTAPLAKDVSNAIWYVKDINHPPIAWQWPFAEQLIRAMNQMAISLFKHSNQIEGVIDWEKVAMGRKEGYKDDLHPGMEMNAVYLNYLMHVLANSEQSDQQKVTEEYD